ncbi:hypothetical protein [Photorhabdus bodei]|uniref:Uncharacterized protein n=1 Tax=Photorhabdus bodei TaxID=2029681 RepID=A0ABX0AZ43_9GAMM|nr:hypothetical protein [Photorhabdus bodei]NDL01561.1 hypothetical protein [Photorhabdus bodei]NDL05820.1 hypothetical protein [Photorhabdus bodei]NDL10064.1 hypothetical protein [Photorhabdus bodei]
MTDRNDHNLKKIIALSLATGAGYFSYSPEIGFNRYKFSEEATLVTNKEIDLYRTCSRDDCWDSEIENICWGIVTQKTTKSNKNDYIPSDIDENFIYNQIQSDAVNNFALNILEEVKTYENHSNDNKLIDGFRLSAVLAKVYANQLKT